MKSFASSVYPIATAIEPLRRLVGKEQHFVVNGRAQELLAQEHDLVMEGLPQKLPNMVALGTTCPHTFREHMAMHSLHHQDTLGIPDFPEGSFGIAGVLYSSPRWQSYSTRTTILDGRYQAMHRNDATLLKYGSGERLVVRIDDADGHRFFFTPALRMEEFFDDFQLVRMVENLRHELRTPKKASVVLPIIEMDALYRPEWICGLKIVGSECSLTVTTAMIHTRVNVGHLTSSKREIEDEVRADIDADLTFTPPLILWVERPGLEFPFLSAMVFEDALKA